MGRGNDWPGGEVRHVWVGVMTLFGCGGVVGGGGVRLCGRAEVGMCREGRGRREGIYEF